MQPLSRFPGMQRFRGFALTVERQWMTAELFANFIGLDRVPLLTMLLQRNIPHVLHINLILIFDESRIVRIICTV